MNHKRIICALCCAGLLLQAWLFGAEEKKQTFESTVPPEPYRAIPVPEWVKGAVNSTHPSAQCEYICRKTAFPIRIDGRLDEWAWQRAPSVSFAGYVNKTEPPYPSEAKVLWDDDYLYVAFRFLEPDIRSYWTFNEANAPYFIKEWEKRDYPKVYYKDGEYGPEEARIESWIMLIDRFAKIFLDPDGDGRHYMETHINAQNNTFTCWYELPLQGCPDLKKGTTDGNNKDILFSMPGMKTAVHIDGTLNNPHDIDTGWTVEVAMPWKTLKHFSVKKRAPLPGEVWGIHLARVFRSEIDNGNEYWGWPYLDIRASHQTEKYGKLRFADHDYFQSVLALGLPADAASIEKAADLGVTEAAVPAGYPAEARAKAEARGIRIYPAVSLMDWDEKDGKAPWQVMTEQQERYFAALEGRDVAPDDPDHAMRKRGTADESDYRFGDTPSPARRRKARDTFGHRVLCPSDPLVREIIRKRIKAVCDDPKNTGLVLEGVGFQNFTGCLCKNCRRKGVEVLADFANTMTDYAKSLRPGIKVIVHQFPTFPYPGSYSYRFLGSKQQPEPEWKADMVLRTASWYSYREPWLVRTLAKQIAGIGKNMYPATAVGDIDTDLNIRLKSPERADLELQALLAGGSPVLALQGVDVLIRHPELFKIYGNYIHTGKKAKEPQK